MIIIYILLALFALLVVILLFPLKIDINYNVNTTSLKDKTQNLNTNNYVRLYILNGIKIAHFDQKNKQSVNKIGSNNNKKIKNKNKDNKKKRMLNSNVILNIAYKFIIDLLNIKKMNEAVITKEDLAVINKNINFEKLILNIGINFKEVLTNAYLIAFLNSAINMYLAKNIDRINLENTEYTTYISNEILNIKIDSIIKLNLVNTIIVIFKVLFRFRKVVKKNGRTTSNRKFNDDSYDFA